MTNRTTSSRREEAWRSQLFYAHIAEQAAAQRRAMHRRHAMLFGVAFVVLFAVAFITRS